MIPGSAAAIRSRYRTTGARYSWALWALERESSRNPSTAPFHAALNASSFERASLRPAVAICRAAPTCPRCAAA